MQNPNMARLFIFIFKRVYGYENIKVMRLKLKRDNNGF